MGVRNFYALVSFALCAFVTITIAIEFFKGARAIQTKGGHNLISSMVELTHRNTRRYGGYLVHMGVVSCLSASPAKRSISTKRCR